MNENLKSFLKFLLFLSIGLGILYLLFDNMNDTHLAECAENGIPESECSLVDKLIENFKSVKVFWIIVICVIFMISNILRALRWNQLLEPLG